MRTLYYHWTSLYDDLTALEHVDRLADFHRVRGPPGITPSLQFLLEEAYKEFEQNQIFQRAIAGERIASIARDARKLHRVIFRGNSTEYLQVAEDLQLLVASRTTHWPRVIAGLSPGGPESDGPWPGLGYHLWLRGDAALVKRAERLDFFMQRDRPLLVRGRE